MLAFLLIRKFEVRRYNLSQGGSPMSIFRLLPFSLLIAVSVASVAAQSPQERNPVVAQSTEPGQLSSSASADLFSPKLKNGLNPPKPLDRIRIGDYRPQLNQFSVPRSFLVGPDGQPQDDTLCYAMRSYKVARDDPQSDSTHAAGYSTCQPAARFHVHTIEGGARPATP